ncbi:MAG: phytochelatin synthase family protein [Roseomonas sp.]|nr:phytochelatin synthase family protein [Roseomonas sp.]
MGFATLHRPLFSPYRRLTQDSLFTEQNLRIKPFAAVQSSGLTLEQLGAFAGNLGVETQSLHAEDLEILGLREKLLMALREPNTRILVNYSRIPLDQEGDGHISPLAAYDEASDSVLVLDVVRYKYSPVWIPIDSLFAAMQRVDPDAGRSRGLLFLKLRGQP